MKSILIAVGLCVLLLSACKTIPGCPRSSCNYKEDLTVYGQNVRLFYEDSFRDVAGTCQFRQELTTGSYVPSTNQEAITILRNMAGEIAANALVFQAFRRDRDAIGRAYVCGAIPTASVTPSNANPVTQPSNPSVTNTFNTQQVVPTSNVTQAQNTNSVLPASSAAATVTDTGRRLSWQTCSLGQNYQAGKCAGQARAEALQTATSYCASLSTAGYTFRLPDRLELASLIKEGATGAKADSRVFPDTKADIYWTREAYNGSPITNWIVDFGGGGSFGYGTENQAYVRCVANLP